MSQNAREPIELLVKLLVNGGQVECRGFTWAMSDDGDVGWVDDKDKETLHGTGMTMQALYMMADEIGKDELWLKCCALNLPEPPLKEAS